MDEDDQAQGEEEAHLQKALARRRATLQATGSCWYCREGLREGLLFCDTDCGLEYEREEAIRGAQYRRE